MALISTVTEGAFAARRQRDWDELDALTKMIAMRGIRALAPVQVTRVSPLYRDVCADLARARAARYSAPLVEYLQSLTATAHAALYGAQAARAAGGKKPRLRAFVAGFPRAIRRRWRPMTISAALFFVPLVFGVVLAYRDASFAFKVTPEAMLRQLADAYAEGFNGRDFGESAAMAGFYVNNNVGIALRCFALGIFGGLGSAFFLVHNGLSIGATLGYVAAQGAGDNIVTFIVGHGSFELGAIVISGGAGLAIGWAIVAPGEKTRSDALQAVGRDVVIVVCGAAVMLLFAAAIEGFWSASSVPVVVKRTIGAVFFLLVVAYVLFVGRGAKDADDDDDDGAARADPLPPVAS